MKREELGKYWKKIIKGRPANAEVIDPASVVTAPWVRLKCKYGCEMYGRGYCCPPETPTPEQTSEMLDCYQRAILFHYQASKKEGENRSMARKAFIDAFVELEGALFKDGYYKAFALISGPCSLCAECAKSKNEPCNFGARARPSMESCGIDVYHTAWNNGFPLLRRHRPGAVPAGGLRSGTVTDLPPSPFRSAARRARGRSPRRGGPRRRPG